MPLIDDYSAFLIDLDGVVYLDRHPLPGVADVVTEIRRRGLGLLFLSNNSAATPEQYSAKLGTMGVQADPSDFMTSGQVLARYLTEHYRARGKTCFIIGEAGLEQAMEESGLKIVVGDAGRTADFVVVGWDRSFDYEKLKTACVAIRKGATYIVTNRDPTYPAPGELWPGAGAIVAAVTTAAGREPVAAVGKPNPYAVELALERLGASREDALMVGDRLETDIMAGAAAGVDTALVLTGVSKKEDIGTTHIEPTFIIDSVASLI